MSLKAARCVRQDGRIAPDTVARRHPVWICVPAIAGVLIMTACQSQKESLEIALRDAGKERQSLEMPPLQASSRDDGVDTIATGAVKGGTAAGDAGNSAEAGDTIAAYRPPVPGTILHYRNNWATLPSKTTFRVDKLERIGNKDYVRLTVVGAEAEPLHAYYDASNYALKGYRDDKDAAVVTFKPVEERYRFPMRPGDKWVSQWRSMSHRDRKISEGGGVVEVVRMETIELAAGSFRAMKIRLPLPPSEFPGMRHFIWFSPKLGVTIKEEITNGRINWTQVLEKVELPG